MQKEFVCPPAPKGEDKLEGQLRQAQKMEAIGQLAGGIAHDFNNLLTAILGYSQILLSKVHDSDPLHSHIVEIQKAGERAAVLTRQLLTFSRKQILQPRVIDVNAVVQDTQKMLQRLIGEDIELAILPDLNLGSIRADPGQIEQVIMNLSINSRDAMPRGGTLTIETSNVSLDEAQARQYANVAAGLFVMLSVRDTGTGMSQEVMSHLFEPFFTTKEPGKGTGLGLSTVYGIVSQSGGHIGVESEPGKGATFKVYFPRIEEPAAARVKNEFTEESLRGSETVLLVEDEDMVRDLLFEILTLHGYNVIEARNGGEALLLCERRQEPIHLMVTDVVMPRMSGAELARRLAPLHPEMKVLYMSGYTNDVTLRHGILDAGVPFIQKPFTIEALGRKVRDVMAAPQSRL